MKQGIDVSKWQPKVDWQKVKADGIDFAIIRVGFCYNSTAEPERSKRDLTVR